MSNPVAKRLVKNVAAHGFAQILTIVTTLVSVPLFLGKWGPVRYGDWILLTALPGYLTITDLGFGPTAGNEMTMLAGAGRQEQVQRVYRSVWILILALSAAVLAISWTLALALPFDRWLGLKVIGHREAVLTMLFLIGQIVLAQQGAVISAAYRCGGFYATGLWANDSLKFLEFLALVAIVAGGGGPALLTGTVLGLRVVNYLIQYVYVRRLVPWLSLGFRGASLETVRPLVGPALAYTALPLAQATTLQGSVIVAGRLAGPTGAVIFNTTRTMSRFVFQAVSVITNSTWPEFSRAIGAGDLDVARRLHRRACQVGLWLAIVGCGVTAVVGPRFFSHWSMGKAPFRPDVLLPMLVVVIVNSLWTVSYVVPLSVNRHQRLTYTYLGATVLGLVASAVLGKLFGLPGVAWGLVLVDLAMVAVVLPISMRLLEDDSGFLSLMRPPFRWFAGKIGGLVRRGKAA